MFANQPDLFSAAAALQPRPQAGIAGAGYRCLLDHPLTLKKGRYVCTTCEGK